MDPTTNNNYNNYTNNMNNYQNSNSNQKSPIPNQNIQNSNPTSQRASLPFNSDWTSYNAYKPALPVQVRTVFSTSKSNQQANQTNPNISDLFIFDNGKLAEFKGLEKEIMDRKKSISDYVNKSKKNFTSIVLNDNKINYENKVEILKRVSANLGEIIETNDNLKNKLSKYSSYYNKINHSITFD